MREGMMDANISMLSICAIIDTDFWANDQVTKVKKVSLFLKRDRLLRHAILKTIVRRE